MRLVVAVTALEQETTAPLAWTHEQLPFQTPPTAIAWKVRRYDGKPGRPPAVWTREGPLHLGLEATMEDLRAAVGNEPGSYRLYPIDEVGNELTPIACIELVPDGTQSMVPIGDQRVTAVNGVDDCDDRPPAQLFDFCRSMLASRDAHDALMANLMTTLVTTTATLQQSTAALLDAANATIKVANGLDAIERYERPPEVDIDDLAAKLAEALDPGEAESAAPHWLAQVLTGPGLVKAMQVAQGLIGTVAAARAAASQKAAEPTTCQARPRPNPAEATLIEATPAPAPTRHEHGQGQAAAEQAIEARPITRHAHAHAPRDLDHGQAAAEQAIEIIAPAPTRYAPAPRDHDQAQAATIEARPTTRHAHAPSPRDLDHGQVAAEQAIEARQGARPDEYTDDQ